MLVVQYNDVMKPERYRGTLLQKTSLKDISSLSKEDDVVMLLKRVMG